MKKLGLATALLLSLVMAGCAQTDIYSGSVYSGQQAKEARSISYGTIVSVRDVKIRWYRWFYSWWWYRSCDCKRSRRNCRCNGW